MSDDDLEPVARGDHERWAIDGLVALLADLRSNVTNRVLDATGYPLAERPIVASAPDQHPVAGR